MTKIGKILKDARIRQGLTSVEAAELISIDASLLSRMENGNRMPTKEQLNRLANLYHIPIKELQIGWLAEKVQYSLEGEEYALEALQLAEAAMAYGKDNLEPADLIKKINKLKERLDKIRPLPKLQLENLRNYYKVQYTYDSNRIEGNTLTLQETALVVDKGITISGKSVQEHLEAVNHAEAVEYIIDLAQNKEPITEYAVKQIHALVLRGIDKHHAGIYRSVNVMISGSKHRPPQPFMLHKLMEDYFLFYEQNKRSLHPVILAAEMHERLVTIHPFIDGNGRTSRLLMNLILLKAGYPITTISSEKQNRLAYYQSLEAVQTTNNKKSFYEFVSKAVLMALTDYLSIVTEQ